MFAFPHIAARSLPPFVALVNRLAPAEIADLIERTSALPRQRALLATAPGGVSNPSFRQTDVSWVYPTRDLLPFFARLSQLVAAANETYGFDLSGIGEPAQLTEYHAPSTGYSWHVDMTATSTELTRKLSLTVQLSAPEDYDGGQLELRDGDEIVSGPRDAGTIVAFPSWVIHRVTPVTRGLRRSLVVWVGGPPFR